MKFRPGDRVRWATKDLEGVVLDDHSQEWPEFVPVQWDNGGRTFSATTHIQTIKSRDASPKSVTAEEINH